MIGSFLAVGEKVVTIGNAPFVVGAGLVAVFVWVWFRLRRQGRRREQLLQLKAAWGRPAEVGRDFETLREFHQVYPSGPADVVVDDATWRDLNMDAIYAMVDRTCSTPGGCMLYQVLRVPVMSKETLAQRGELIGLFTNDPGTREALQMELLGVGKSNARALVALIFNERPMEMMARWMTVGLTLLATACLAGALLTGQPVLTVGVFVLFATNMWVHSRAKSQLLGRLDALRQLGGMITAAERIARQDHAKLREFIEPLREAAGRTARIARNVSMLLPEGSSSGDLAAMALEYVSIYFLHEVRTFQTVMADIASRREALRTIFARLGELDAWQSVASFRAGLGGYCEPVFAEDGPRLEVRDVKHPLLGEAVANSIAIETRGVAITGSNMSGKTTFLRTVGVNVLLAQTIYTCRAATYRGRFMRVIASMDESDDLLEGKSYYLVEAERLLKIVKESERPGLVLALIDEPLAGTNSPQRLAASREILRYLVGHNALAMVCTHDVELVSQLQARGDFEACHFSDLADETGIHFDYLLRQGLDYHGNAIRVLKHLGYPEAILAGAMADLEGMGEAVKQVIVVQPDPRWAEMFVAASRDVAAAMGENLVAIHHIGSTAIPGIYAKPVIDMLAVVSDIGAVDSRGAGMESLGYEVMGEFGIPGRRYFRRDDSSGVRTHQVHAFANGSRDVERHLAFRDFMRGHPGLAREYGELKRGLAERFPTDIESYMDGKDAFIKEMEARAMVWAAGKSPGE